MTESIYAAKPWLAQLNKGNAAVYPAPTLVHAFHDAVVRVPARTAVAYFDARLSYREVDTLSDSVAGHLAARGVEPGERVAIMLQNSPHFVIALLGAWKAGAVVVPLNPMYKTAEVGHALADAEATALVCADHAWESYLRDAAGVSDVRVVLTACELDLQTRNDARVLGFERLPVPVDTDDLLTVASQGLPAPAGRGPDPDDTALISYTSGTGGHPKGAMNTHRNITFSAERLVIEQGFAEGRCFFVLAPLFHITGMVCQLAASFVRAHTLAMTYRFEPGVVLDAFAEHRPVFTVGPATAFMALAAHPDVTPGHFSSFEHLSSGGAPLPPALVDSFNERFDAYLHNGYGLSESTSHAAFVPPGKQAPVDPASGTLSVGVPGADTVVRIVDDNGDDVPFGDRGEIMVNGPQVAAGYWRQPEATEQTFPHGELHTGDVGFMDSAGWLYLVDRKKDLINASGFKVWPREVEDVLYTHPAVREAAVVGIPDAYRGETVKAYVSLRPGVTADPEALARYCKDRLAAYKYPRVVEILPELPKTTSGKILRRTLRPQA
jgi:long-chain acyl-CoA synthetase